MITTTFSYDNCISTYTLVVDRTSSTTTQRWLSERGVKFRTGYEISITINPYQGLKRTPEDPGLGIIGMQLGTVVRYVNYQETH